MSERRFLAWGLTLRTTPFILIPNMKRKRGPQPGKSRSGKRAPAGARQGSERRPTKGKGRKQSEVATARPARRIIGADEFAAAAPSEGAASPAGSKNRDRSVGSTKPGSPPRRRPRKRFGRPPKQAESAPTETGTVTKSAAPIPIATGPQRLQKVLAAAGIGSRRRCEELIVDGRVEVDRQVVDQLGSRVDPDTQEISVDGVALPRTKRVYYLVNKPVGVVSTNYDPAGRSRVIDLVHAGGQRVYTVGRLDRTSEGLILVTNDGELANRLMHPRYGVEKTYLARVAGTPSDEVLEQLTTGVRLAEGIARAEQVTVRSTQAKSTLLEIVLREGRNREVRRILARVGHKVLELKRIALGPLRLKDLKPGEVRRLTTE
ncbi:MAG: pseudouridine synthase, partial [Pirellulales bacterium]